MYGQNRCSLYAYLVLAASCAMALESMFGDPGGSAHTPSQALPYYVEKLSAWPDSIARGSSVRVPEDDRRVLDASRMARRWLRKVVAEAWLPRDDVSPVFHQREFSEIDVARIRWQHNGWDIHLSQTRGILAIVLKPANGTGTGHSPEEKARIAEGVCLELFAKEVTRHVPLGKIIPVKNINQKITRCLFRSGRRATFANGMVWGRGKTLLEAGVLHPRPPDEAPDSEGQAGNSDDWWDRSPNAWEYWFRAVRWWNDGNRIGFYFPKAQHRPTGIEHCFSKAMNSGWFRMPVPIAPRRKAEETGPDAGPEASPESMCEADSEGGSPKSGPGPREDSLEEESARTAAAPSPPKRNVLPLALGIGGVLLLAAALVLYRRQKTASN